MAPTLMWVGASKGGGDLRYIAVVLICSLMFTGCAKSDIQTSTMESESFNNTVELCENGTVYQIDRSDVQGILDYINSKPRRAQTNAYIDSEFVFHPTVEATTVNTSNLLQEISKGSSRIDIEDFYVSTPDSNYKFLEELAESLNNFHIAYSNGRSITGHDVLTLSGNDVLVNKDKLRSLVTEITLEYDTVGKEAYDITLHNGTQIQTKSNTWGNLSDTKAEQDYALTLCENLQPSENRVPIMKETSSDVIPNRVIEVDIEAQKLYVTEGETVLMETDIVTGRTPDRSTPKGAFKVLEKRKEKDLRGPGYVSHVHRWMRLTWSGVGLHDATWRSCFGGNIYTYDGSHGCINLPKDFAYELYEVVNVGDCVIIF